MQKKTYQYSLYRFLHCPKETKRWAQTIVFFLFGEVYNFLVYNFQNLRARCIIFAGRYNFLSDFFLHDFTQHRGSEWCSRAVCESCILCREQSLYFLWEKSDHNKPVSQYFVCPEVFRQANREWCDPLMEMKRSATCGLLTECKYNGTLEIPFLFHADLAR